MKRAEFVVEAESPLGVIRGLGLASAQIEKDAMVGSSSLPKHGVSVRWRIVDVVKATDVSKGSILTPEPGPVAPNLPDVSAMDIEEAKGIVATAGSNEELDILEMVEKSSARFPGGRKGVLVFINHRRVELSASAEKKAKEAANKAAGKAPPESTTVLTQGGAVVEGPKTK
jgi:hypothetical protein